MADRLPLALTLGDPAGIGPEITFAAWLDRDARGLAPFVLVAPPAMVRGLRDRLSPGLPLERVEYPASAGAVFGRALPVWYPDEDVPPGIPQSGIPDPSTAGVVIGS
ncbi:MAG: 4-hydroxythreonine-4-phosphate dehydrogenase, partial [Sphingomonadales bacterium]